MKDCKGGTEEPRDAGRVKRYFLSEDEIPRQWYNIQAEMPNKPMAPLNPATMKPLKA